MKTTNRNGAGRGHKNSAQALVEFAFALPLLALLLFAIIQYGLIFASYMTLRHAAHVTARNLSLAGATTNAAAARDIACQAISPLLNCQSLAAPVVSLATVQTPNDAIRVQLTYTQPLIIRFVVPNTTTNTLTLRAEATYRRN
ncbi:MAG: pilus assembly protein [Verrucomicrobiae bacterium]|nr:pilus assembly protein [Verrucomicrobiae bacterium]